MAAIVGALSVGVSLAQAYRTKKVTDANVKKEKKYAELRAEERQLDLKKTLASQRVALIAQGADADVGTSLSLYADTEAAYERAQELDDLETATSIYNTKAKGSATSASYLSSALSSSGSYFKAKGETKLGAPTTTH